jgi:uncharacterized membrane protein
VDYAHIHLLLNHIPILGTIFAFCLLLLAYIKNSNELKQVSLGAFVVVMFITIPAFLSGTGAAQKIKDEPAISMDMINTHQGAAMLAFLFMLITGGFALVGWWQSQRESRPRPWIMGAVILFSVITMGQMARTGNLGGEIRHPEIRSADAATDPGGSGISKMLYSIEPSPDKFTKMVLANKWIWAVILDFHFFGLILLVVVVGILDMRVLGFSKQVPFAPLNQLLPWGLLGFAIQILSGLVIFMGMPIYYTWDLAFFLKVVAILLAGANLLVFYVTSVFRKCDAMGPGDDAPLSAKFLAGTSMFLWLAVIVLGRYIQSYSDTINH